MEPGVFSGLLSSKGRSLRFTRHSILAAVKRGLIQDGEQTVIRFEEDIHSQSPYKVAEQDSEIQGERKFKVYYAAPKGGYMAYILTINSEIRLITLWWTTKKIQKLAYQRMRRLGHGLQRAAIKR